ncbi:phage portal protein, PBSX family [Shewanella sp. W3-18-1]|uniref:phage portal protein n=1 Tax=Shewanella sp. (strain W3-18-1) TaxID=351745 RepID=UPI00005FDAE5|nr:phage portal protein [Shewanella sp. W3-18-1]ABM25718.1 phage portal protein, PBSX family [Shewanella sp. W3-18-1]
MGDATLTAANDDTHITAESPAKTVVFSMPETVMPNMWLTDYDSLYFNQNDNYWEPPVDRQLLANLTRRNAQHGGIVQSRANMATARYTAGGMSTQEMGAAFLNCIQFGDVALLKIRNGFGQVLRLFPLPSYRTRVAGDGGAVVLERENTVKRYKAKDIIWVRVYDPVQQVYGCPDYLGGLQSALLNEDSTLFRRKYYINGAHMGFILYSTDPNLDADVEKDIKEKIQESKGVGNFKSLFVNIPNGKEKGIQIIPVGNFESKDEFMNVKNVSSQDVFNAHRFPAGLGGMIPTNTAGLGDPTKYDEVYFKSETRTLINMFVDAVNRAPEIGSKLKLVFDMSISTNSSIGA